MTLIKRAKANWHYHCEACDFTSPRSPDRFGAECHEFDHERTPAHAQALFVKAAQGVVDAFAAAVTHTINAMGAIAAVFEEPPNAPRDPSLRRDRRVWGGK